MKHAVHAFYGTADFSVGLSQGQILTVACHTPAEHCHDMASHHAECIVVSCARFRLLATRDASHTHLESLAHRSKYDCCSAVFTLHSAHAILHESFIGRPRNASIYAALMPEACRTQHARCMQYAVTSDKSARS